MLAFPKKYSHNFEKDMYDFREQQGLFTPEGVRKKKANTVNEKFMITMPPPNVT